MPEPATSHDAPFPAGTALVLGGSGGLGAAICHALAAAGSDVALTYRSSAAAADAVAADVRAAGRTATTHALDVTDGAAVRALVDAVAADAPLHTLVLAAGMPAPIAFASQADGARWRDAFAVEADGAFHAVQAALPHLRARDGAAHGTAPSDGAAPGGSIVALTSAGLERFPARDLLSVAPKAAVTQLMRAVAREEGKYGVRANAVAVGVVEAGMFLHLKEAELDSAWLDAARAATPLGRFGRAEDVAEAVVFLASRRAGYITGQTLVVDGGWSV